MVTIGQWYMDAGAEAIGAGSARDLEVTLEQFSTIWIDNLVIPPPPNTHTRARTALNRLEEPSRRFEGVP